ARTRGARTVGLAVAVWALGSACRPRYEAFGPPRAVLMRDQATAAPALIEPRIPPRAPGAMGGSEFMDAVKDFDPAQRERAIYLDLTAGNLPEFLRTLVPVRITAPDGQGPAAVVHVMPDYLAIGSNDDYVRVPMNFYTATAVAREWGFVLPTSRIVDAI